jgi:hypothetical protein
MARDSGSEVHHGVQDCSDLSEKPVGAAAGCDLLILF